MPETCSTCGREAPVVDGVLGIHYNSGLLRCEGSGLPVDPTEAPEPEVPAEKPVKKAAPRKKPAKP
jgi:hypothetical protein